MESQQGILLITDYFDSLEQLDDQTVRPSQYTEALSFIKRYRELV
jgi:hypothetical protein